MDLLQAAIQLRPGTSWNCIGGRFFQAEDDTERVDVPSKTELQSLVDADFDWTKVSNLS